MSSSAVGATIDFVIDMMALVREKREAAASLPAVKSDALITAEETPAPAAEAAKSMTDRLIYIFHTLSRADFCFIIFALTVTDFVWILLPFGAIGAQVYWMTDLYKHARRRSGARP